MHFKLFGKIVDKIWNRIVCKPFDKVCDYLDQHKGHENDPDVSAKIEKLGSMGLGMDTYCGLQMRAHRKVDSIMGSKSNPVLRKLYFSIFFHLYKIQHWFDKPFFLLA